MENQKIENEVKVEEVVETEVKTKKGMPGWLKNTLIAVGGIAVGAVATALLGDSDKQTGVDLLEGADEEPILLEQNSDGKFEVVDEFKNE